MRKRTILYSAVLIGILATFNTSRVYAENTMPISNVEEEKIMVATLQYDSPRNLKKAIKKMILDEYIKENPQKANIDYDKTDITFDTEIDMNAKTPQLKKVSLNFHYTDKEDVSLVADLTRSVMLNITEGGPVIELKKDEINIVKTTEYDLNSVVAFSGAYDCTPVFTIDKGSFNNNQVGSYDIEYRITDLKGKVASKTLRVNVVEQKTSFYDVDGTLLGESEGALDETAFPEIDSYNVVDNRVENGNVIYTLEKKPYVAPARGVNQSGQINYQQITGGDYVQQALSAVGRVPYVWGGTTTGGWDCSGMVQCLTGIGARTAEQQSYTGTRHYDIWNAPYGSLLFYDNGSGAYHVGISLGNGSMVHAANASDGTIVTNLQYFTPNYWVMPGQ